MIRTAIESEFRRNEMAEGNRHMFPLHVLLGYNSYFREVPEEYYKFQGLPAKSEGTRMAAACRPTV